MAGPLLRSLLAEWVVRGEQLPRLAALARDDKRGESPGRDERAGG
jgi:hypothetical protein